MTPHLTIPGIEAWEIDPAGAEIHAIISRDRPPPPTRAVEEEWAKRTAANPRLYDGPLLAVQQYDHELARITCRRDGFMRLAVQPAVPTGVRLLAVTALLSARDDGGREHVLLGRRSPQTRIFGGMWEIGPSGGVSPPPAAIEHMDLACLSARLSEEISEEIGLDVVCTGTPVAYVRDLVASSDDLVLRFSLGRLADAAHLARPANWEYTETIWMPTDTAGQWDDPAQTIAATRAIYRVMGWIDPT
ncbi:MAG: hypothetical protein KF864_01655 [Phycisphaeraceae bacterium]|nr:hypothetical protein [Phycisphaeraceae bacterium]